MSRAMAGVCLVAALSFAAPAGAFVQYNADAGWPLYLDSGLEYGHLVQQEVPPVSVETFDFSSHGMVCPDAGTPNFLCARFAAKADLVGGVFSLHSLARVVRHNAKGTSTSIFGYADTVIDMSGLESAIFPASGFAVFVFGMHGTTVSTTNNVNVHVQTSAAATLQAGVLNAIQCAGDGACTPINLHMTTDPSSLDGWHPHDEIRVELRTDVRIDSAPIGIDGWDAESIADFGDTLELLAIEIQDENHVPVPEAHIIIPNATGPGTMLEIPNVPAPSTTTTSTLPSATTTTSTLPSATEVCGNCLDDDADGLVDFEEPLCCPAADVRAFTLRNARLVSAGPSSLVSVTASIAGTALADVVPGRDVFLQVRGGAAAFCARIPADRFVVKHGKTAVFADRKQTVAEANGITKVTLHAAKGALSVHLAGPHAHLALPPAGTVELVVAFRDSGGGTRCSSDAAAFRKAGKKGLRAP